MYCHECGGPADDANTRRRLGCDEPTKRPHRLVMGDEIEEINYCPRKYMRPAVPFLKAHRWSKAGSLALMYPDGIPCKVAEAIEIIEDNQARRMREESERK